ncbi:hypothetical protein [Aestuariibius sp. HNIBRBA575]|uniref:hypothetical protein n=1 Tax=Aestuariibius sp. HNIBRBA575 TaxID=3233343 RepID=UPI0034A230C1
MTMFIDHPTRKAAKVTSPARLLRKFMVPVLAIAALGVLLMPMGAFGEWALAQKVITSGMLAGFAFIFSHS